MLENSNNQELKTVIDNYNQTFFKQRETIKHYRKVVTSIGYLFIVAFLAFLYFIIKFSNEGDWFELSIYIRDWLSVIGLCSLYSIVMFFLQIRKIEKISNKK